MSPEIWEHDEYSKSSDVYAFAFIAYEVFYVKTPFKGQNFDTLMAKICNRKRPEFDSSVPDCYKDLIERCWSQDPNERPTFAEITKILSDDKYALKEFEFLVSFHHPCICRALKINTAETVKNKKDQTTVSIYLEYFKYKLTDYLIEPLCNNTIKTRIAVEVAFGMSYLHSLEMIHRDLKH